MGVRAKFRVHNVTPRAGWSPPAALVELGPVYSGSEENKSFFAATPSGSISLTITNDVAAQWFKPNTEVYVDFSEAADPK